jgi:hypothetical protein
MDKNRLILNIVVIGVVSIILIIIARGFSNNGEGTFIFVEATEMEQEVPVDEYEAIIIVPIVEKDSYEVRFGDIIYYPELEEFYIPLIASEIESRDYVVTVIEEFGGRKVKVYRTGVKEELYHSYENVFWFRDGYTKDYFVEVTYDGAVIEKIKIEQ